MIEIDIISKITGITDEEFIDKMLTICTSILFGLSILIPLLFVKSVKQKFPKFFWVCGIIMGSLFLTVVIAILVPRTAPIFVMILIFHFSMFIFICLMIDTVKKAMKLRKHKNAQESS